MYKDQISCQCGCAHGHSPSEHATHDHAHEHEHEHDHAHEHEHGEHCSHAPLIPDAAADAALLAKASATRALYRIRNMDCPMEAELIRKKLGNMAGIVNLEFNFMQRVLTVEHDLSDTAGIEAALRSIDMTPEPLSALHGAATSGSAAYDAPPTVWKRLALAGALAALSEAADILLHWNLAPLGLNLATWTVNDVALGPFVPLVLAVLAILIGGLSTYKKGWIAVRNANLNINALMSVAVTGAVLIGQYPEAAMVMVLFHVSEAIEAKALDRARKAVQSLLALTPEKATILQPDGTWQDTDIKEVPVGSVARVKPGERIALDGVLQQGQSTVNQAPITGESMPIEKQTGDTVYAGTINQAGSFTFTVTAPASGSTLARIIHAVEEAQGSRAPIQRFVDIFARYYTPAVFLVSLLSGLLPPLLWGALWTESIYTALVILVIGCPCALVISTPVSIVSGMAAATRLGILIKGGLFLEQGRLLSTLALDKTGTLTHGKPQQTDFVDLAPSTVDAPDKAPATMTVSVAASLAARSDHPVSGALAGKAKADGVEILDVQDFMAIPGQGVRGVVQGKLWHLGNARLVEELGLSTEQEQSQRTAWERQGKSVVALMNAQGVQGLFAVADTLKESSITAVRELKALGITTVMLSGDNLLAAEAMAAEAGVDSYQGNMLPEDKLRAIEDLVQRTPQGRVGMVGDGINDAPALARAHIGFAMAGNGTDTAIETADVALMDDDLRKIPRFIRLSRATHAILVQNITLALGVKALCFALTFAGYVSMWMAVFADVGTALLVVANGLRAARPPK